MSSAALTRWLSTLSMAAVAITYASVADSSIRHNQHPLKRQVAGRDFSWAYSGRETDDGDFGPVSAYVNSDGDWGTTGHVSNHSIWCHYYKYVVRFKHGDVVYFTGETNRVQLCGHHDETDSSGGGQHVDALSDNFASIDSADMQLVEFN